MTDGRHARSQRTREDIVDALLALLSSGESLPASSDVARRAGVTQRTLFHHFPDVGTLLAAAVERQVVRVRSSLPRPESDGPALRRVDRYVDTIAPVLEEIAPIRWAVVTYSHDVPQLLGGLRRIRTATRRRLALLVRAELEALDRAERRELLDALEIATDPVTWRLLRVQQQHSVDGATDVLRRTVRALVQGANANRTTGTRRRPG